MMMTARRSIILRIISQLQLRTRRPLPITRRPRLHIRAVLVQRMFLFILLLLLPRAFPAVGFVGFNTQPTSASYLLLLVQMLTRMLLLVLSTYLPQSRALRTHLLSLLQSQALSTHLLPRRRAHALPAPSTQCRRLLLHTPRSLHHTLRLPHHRRAHALPAPLPAPPS